MDSSSNGDRLGALFVHWDLALNDRRTSLLTVWMVYYKQTANCNNMLSVGLAKYLMNLEKNPRNKMSQGGMREIGN